jgi:transposase InsO family protein
VTTVRSFLGVAGYYRKYVPNFSLVAAPLSALLVLNSPFRKDPEGAWGPPQQDAFDTLKRALLQPPVLRIFDAHRATLVRTDASEWGMGAVLYQQTANGEWHPVEYKSKRFTATQMRYAPHDREFCAVLYAFRTWRHMLLNRHFLLETDNSAVSHIKQSKELSSKYARWLGLFEEMDCEVRHRPGRKMQLEDWLSRPPADLVDAGEIDLDPDEQMCIFEQRDPLLVKTASRPQGTGIGEKEAHGVSDHGLAALQAVSDTTAGGEVRTSLEQHRSFVRLGAVAGRVADLWHDSRDRPGCHRALMSAQLYIAQESSTAMDSLDDDCDVDAEEAEVAAGQPAVTLPGHDGDGSELLVWRHPSMPSWPELYAGSDEWKHRWNGGAGDPTQRFVVRHNILFKVDDNIGWRLCVPQVARADYLREIHGTPLAGHRGKRKTLAHARWLYWDTLAKDVYTFVRTCGQCQRNKVLRMKEAGAAHALPAPPRPWHTFGMDWVGPLPRTAGGHDCILNVVCHHSGMVHFIPCSGTDTAADVARRVMEDVVRLHGLPEVVVSDRDPKLTSKFWSSLCDRLGTRLAMSCAYRPQTDGKVERANAVLAEVLRCFVNARMDDWDEHLAAAELAVNSSVSDVTGFTPFFANYGFHPKLPWHTRQPDTDNESAFLWVEMLQGVHVFCRDALQRSKDKQTAYLSTKRRVVFYEVGDRVLLSTKHLKTRTASGKLTARFVGPFEVVAVHKNAVELRLPTIMEIHPVVNVAFVRPYYPRPEALGGEDKATTVDVEGETQYVVETILARRGTVSNPRYLVKWHGADLSEATWEPGADLPAWEISIYENRYPRYPGAGKDIGVQSQLKGHKEGRGKSSHMSANVSKRGAASTEGAESPRSQGEASSDTKRGESTPNRRGKSSGGVPSKGVANAPASSDTGEERSFPKTRRGGLRKAVARAERANKGGT